MRKSRRGSSGMRDEKRDDEDEGELNSSLLI
jgi:hypothetical protein